VRGLTVSLAVVCLGLIGCDGTTFGRIGPPVKLPNDPPRSACEREEWYSLAPARVKAQGVTVGVGYNTVYSKNYEGVGVFQGDDDDPESLDDVFENMKEPALEKSHNARIEPVDDASARSTYWALGGIVGMFAGVGTAAAVEKESGTTAAVFGLSGLAIGIVGVIGALAAQPSGEDQVEADARRRLFLRGEDPALPVVRGVDRANADLRRRCGGTPVPFVPPAELNVPAEAPAPKPAAVPAPETPPSTAPPAPTPAPGMQPAEPATGAAPPEAPKTAPPAATFPPG
jgi:hypothetical protein